MKYIFKILLLCFSLKAHSTKIYIHYETSKENISHSIQVESIFRNKYNIPKDLIIRVVGKCLIGNKDRRFLHLCINKKGELITLSSDISFKIKSLSTFKLLQE